MTPALISVISSFSAPSPGTDAALALGMMNVIINEGLTDDDYIQKYTQGFDALKEHVQDYDPATAAAICGIEASMVTDLAREYAKAKPSLIRYLIDLLPNGTEEGGEVELPLPKCLVASRLAMQPETFSRILADLKSSGLVRVNRSRLFISDPQRLVEISQ